MNEIETVEGYANLKIKYIIFTKVTMHQFALLIQRPHCNNNLKYKCSHNFNLKNWQNRLQLAPLEFRRVKNMGQVFP